MKARWTAGLDTGGTQLSGEGDVWVFADNVDTDVISPGKVVDLPFDEMRKHSLKAVEPRFSEEAKHGDIIVAGRNFGCGSSRESAPRLLKHVGIVAIAAESFGRIFLRSCLALGLPILVAPGVAEHFQPGDRARYDVVEGWIENVRTGDRIAAVKLAPTMLYFLQQGGIASALKARGEAQREATAAAVGA